MPFQTGIRDALSVVGNKPPSAARDAIEGEYVWTLKPGQNAADFVPGLTTVIAFGGKLFMRDDADTTTAHDGVTCIVTSGGIRFKTTDFGAGPLVRIFAVLAIQSTPPASPSVGDIYIVGSGGTGAWATKDGKVAHRTSAGWVYVTPKTYDQAHVASVAQYYHYNASSTWVSGVPALSLADASVPFTKMMHGLGFAVENQTTNTPPGSPSDKVAYIIGPSPTGAWAGHAFKIAYFINAAWLIVAPQIGWQVYDKAIKAFVGYTATGWQASTSGYAVVVDTGAFATTKLCAGGFAFDPMTYAGAYEVLNANYTPKRAGAKIDIEYQAQRITWTPTGGPPASFQIAIGFFVDSEATTTRVHKLGRMWPSDDISAVASFEWTATDTSPHTFRFVSLSDYGDFSHTHTGSRLIIRERA